MRRGNRIAALVRVAELREAVARGEAGRSLVAARAAAEAARMERESLAGMRVAGGNRSSLLASAQAIQSRAGAVVAADQARDEAEAVRAGAVGRWTAARTRHRLLEELAERQREQARVEREKQDQALADELAVARRGDR